MTQTWPSATNNVWCGHYIEPGESRDLNMEVAESYSGLTLKLPIRVVRGMEPGPALFVTAALHGDELNGTGAIRTWAQKNDHPILRGTLVLAPIINIFGFDNHSRYLPDRRDLNRCFPGSGRGSLASRLARVVFEQIVTPCDFGIDLHTAAVRRTNFPNVRADISNPDVEPLAKAFGCELIIQSSGPPGSLRREATAAGCPTIVFEGGEVWKAEPGIVDTTVRGITNVLASLKMIDAAPMKPAYSVKLTKTTWVRADRGGFLDFHVRPGQIVHANDALATNTGLFGDTLNILKAPFDGVVIGMTTLPAVGPGEPVCHIGAIPKAFNHIEKARAGLTEESLHYQVWDHLATNVRVTEPRLDDPEVLDDPEALDDPESVEDTDDVDALDESPDANARANGKR